MVVEDKAARKLQFPAFLERELKELAFYRGQNLCHQDQRRRNRCKTFNRTKEEAEKFAGKKVAAKKSVAASQSHDPVQCHSGNRVKAQTASMVSFNSLISYQFQCND